MNLALFFEGTGQGVAGSYTNVTRMRDLCVEDDEQILHLESGPGTHFGAYASGAIHGVGWRQIFNRAKKRFDQVVAKLAAERATKNFHLYLFGFSRGALIARHFAEWLEPQGFEVDYLGLWDTVDSTINLDVSEICPSNVLAARHAVARDETRRFYSLVPLLPSHSVTFQPFNRSTFQPSQSSQRSTRNSQLSQLVFPGSHSDVGGLYADNHLVADAALDWIARGAVAAGLRLKPGVKTRARRDYSQAILHSEHDDASNLWGAFEPVTRVLKGIRRHTACALTGAGNFGRIRKH